MPTQNLIFVCCPNGLGSGGAQQLSVYLTPRLDQGATLGAFPDILGWTQQIKSRGITFQVRCAAGVTSVAADTSLLRPDLWQSLFSASTYVAAFEVGDFNQRLIVSYPTRDALQFVKFAYQSVGARAGVDFERDGLLGLLQELVFRDGDKSTLAPILSQLRLLMWEEQQRARAAVLAGALPSQIATQTLAAPPPGLATPPDGAPTTLSAPTNTRDVVERAALFHSMPPAPGGPPLPSTPADFAQTLNFHQVLTALASYPSLLRALGLVFDLPLPAGFCATSPAAGSYGTLAVAAVTPGFAWQIAPTLTLPATAYVADAQSFAIAPASAPAAVTAGAFASGDVSQGFVVLAPDDFHLAEVDLDGALLKAIGLADNAANAAGRLDMQQAATVIGQSMPALRSCGLNLLADNRGMQMLASIDDNTSFDQALQSSGPMPRPFDCRDLIRGFRLDVWSARTQQWHSLHRRDSSYAFSSTGSIKVTVSDEEGFLQPTAAQPAPDPTRKADGVATANNIPQPGTDLYVHERVARWDGWSLSAFRPGLALNRSEDPAQALTPDPTLNQPMTPFKMVTQFNAHPGTLPELRFGTGYRMRARAVDLAGNSLPPSSALPADLDPATPAGGTYLYHRFEPVSPPTLLLLAPTSAGAGLLSMVIRSANSTPALDGTATAQSDSRHVVPPKISARLAEQHGLFDDASGHLRADSSFFNALIARDKFAYPQQGGVPIVTAALATVGYLPDPLARGVALRDLPNTFDNTDGRIGNGALGYAVLADAQPREGSVTYIDFGTAWPARTAFRLTLIEGNAAPAWNAASRTLTVSLPKGETLSTSLSCYLNPGDLVLMGVWGWLTEFFTAAEQAAMQETQAGFALGTASDTTALITRLVLEGGHDMITPALTLNLVHAVQQPLGQPGFVQLPVIHQPSNPIYASALRNSFTPITAWRAQSSHSATLLGGLSIHGASTAKIELESSWLEWIDDPATGPPTRAARTAPVETILLSDLTGGEIAADANTSNPRSVAVYVPQVDTLWFAAPIDVLSGVQPVSDIAAPVHAFNDTLHRWVTYQAVATSRYQEYFPAGLDFTRSSSELVVDVPSSARPAAPDLAYVVPTFGWQRAETTFMKSEVRFGNGLRVYLNRPWFSSGADELLGVVCWGNPGAPPDYPTMDKYKGFFSQWGNDPIWTAAYLNAVPTVVNFSASVLQGSALTLAETSDFTVNVAGHSVCYDSGRGQWYCDITFSGNSSYMPFVRLALARYQPHSISGVELSRVTLTDYAQLTPDRSAVLSIDPSDPRQARLWIGGLAPVATPGPAITVTVEQEVPSVVSDLAWQTAAASLVTVTENSPDASEPQAVLWSGSIAFTAVPPAGSFRIVIREYERIAIDGSPDAAGNPPYGERLVYLSILAYDFPSLS